MSQQDEKIAVALTGDVKFSITYGRGYAMTQCWCGDVFRVEGYPDDIAAKQRVWNEAHKDCVERKREGVKTFWMSFCDALLPKGSQFLGACVIDVSAEEADDAAIEVMLRFPFAQDGAEWIAAATAKAHRLGCNPGGEIASAEIPMDHPMLAKYQRGVLMNRADIERIDAEIAALEHGEF